MSSFFGKLRTFSLGTAHDLLDKAIDTNSPSSVRQNVRDLEDALDQMRDQAARQAGMVRTLTRQKDDTQHNIDLKTKATQTSLQQNRQDVARIQAAEVVRLQKTVERLTSDISTQTANSAALDKSVMMLEERHSQMIERLRELERLDQDSKSKEAAAKAMSGAGKLIAGGSDISVDDIESNMRARNDVASEKFNRAMDGVNTAPDAESNQEVDDLLNSLTPKDQKIA